MDVLSTITWNAGNQWSFVRTDQVMTLWVRVGEQEPTKSQAWSLLETVNMQHFLNTLLQKFHMTDKQNLPEVVRTIIIVMNAFTMAAIWAEEHKSAGDLEWDELS